MREVLEDPQLRLAQVASFEEMLMNDTSAEIAEMVRQRRRVCERFYGAFAEEVFPEKLGCGY
jgi:hypothetical protein